ncbi:hypothetical protein [Roseiarcus fermentans]|uniref:hypothetical protein n=1 Tax=Roseiarcus fermentans TaxID=1473586 RepID=UPI0011BFB6F0|nr:hypothetical protein [Roseiarcus fermentans]
MIAAPTNIRGLFDAMADHHRTKKSTEEFVDLFDWAKMGVHDIYCTFLDRLPESEAVVRKLAKGDRREQAMTTIQSKEFQSRIPELFFEGVPREKACDSYSHSQDGWRGLPRQTRRKVAIFTRCTQESCFIYRV